MAPLGPSRTPESRAAAAPGLRHAVALGLFAALVLAGVGPLDAQLVRGEVREGHDAGPPLAGAFVSALDPDGVRIASVLTDRNGTFRLRAPAPGRYRLVVERIGFESVRTDVFALAEDDVLEHSFVLQGRAISLEGITATAEQRCVRRPEEGLAIHALWDEARKALEVSSFVTSGRLFRFRSELYVRELDPTARTVVRELDSRVTTGYDTPFASVPAPELAERGFAVMDGDGWILYAPDADVLLSDDFLDTHCFRVVERPEQRAIVGLAFEPVPRRTLPEVAGVLWLDRTSSELRHLEYRYVNLPLPQEHLGGRVEFDLLESGAWIVQRWWIRSPRTVREAIGTRSGTRFTTRVDGVREEGGEVTAIFTSTGQRVEEAVALGGVVFDSIRGAPLEGARVFLNGTQHSAMTGADGRFEIAGAREGRHFVAFTHPSLAALRAAAPLVEVELVRGSPAEVALAIPPLGSIASAACARDASTDGRAVTGVVRNAGNEIPLAGAHVTLAWQDDGGAREVQAETDANGVYRICGAPPQAPLSLRARFMNTPSEVGNAPPADDTAAAVVDLWVPLQARWEGPNVIREFGDGVLRVDGMLLDERGAPVGGATIRVQGTEMEVRSGEDGRFVLREVPAGVYQLEIAHPAFGSVIERISLGGGRVADMEIRVPARIEPPPPPER